METLQHPIQDTAAHHMVRQVLTGTESETVATLIERLHGSALDFTDTVYVVDSSNRLRGIILLPDLLAASATDTLGQRMVPPRATAVPGDDQEHVAALAVQCSLASVPVVDAAGGLLGVVPPQALIQVLWLEHAEDLHRFAGMRVGDVQALRAMDAPPLRRVRDRLPWLIVGLLGSGLAAFVVSRFEEVLAAEVAVSFFIPGIVYLADAIGTQTEAIAVRGLSASRTPIWRLLLRELVTGFLVGTTLGLLALIFALVAYGNFLLSVSVALAIAFAGTVASSIGLFLPWLIARLGHDPAFGSGPLATVIQDVLSLLIYFLIVQELVS